MQILEQHGEGAEGAEDVAEADRADERRKNHGHEHEGGPDIFEAEIEMAGDERQRKGDGVAEKSDHAGEQQGVEKLAAEGVVGKNAGEPLNGEAAIVGEGGGDGDQQGINHERGEEGDEGGEEGVMAEGRAVSGGAFERGVFQRGRLSWGNGHGGILPLQRCGGAAAGES